MTAAPRPPSWRPQAAPGVLAARARMLATVRRFFADRGVLEVETPVLSAAATTDPQIESFATAYCGPGAAEPRPAWLLSSPELAMKRLLAAGAGDIYQIARAFRNGELGRWHNPEFTLLEWYRRDRDHRDLAAETVELIAAVAVGPRRPGAAVSLAYGPLFEECTGVDPHVATGAGGVAELAAAARRHGIEAPAGLDRTDPSPWLDLLFSHRVQPALASMGLVVVSDYPASQAALARVRPGRPGGGPAVAERFEVFWDGLELANGFHELTDAAEQRARFAAELRRRAAAGSPPVPADERFLAALDAGLPACAGVAVGLDRCLARTLGAACLAEVLAFPWERA